MNTKKLFMLLAAVLLGSVSAFAQSGNSEPLKGDVNEDGTVDVGDITAVIKIMKENAVPQTIYYWYAGQSNPANMTSITPILSGDNEFTSGSGWHLIGSESDLPTSIDQLIKGGTSGKMWYAAIPVKAGLVAGSSSDPDTSVTQGSIVTIEGVQYQIWISEGTTGTRYGAQFGK